MKKKEQPERRQYQRIKKHFILTYFNLADPDAKYSASQLKNISLGGMCLVTSQTFEPSVKLGIELKTPFLSELTHLEGTILESHEKIKDVIYETRMEFDPLSSPAEFVLKKLIDHFEKEEHRRNE